MAGNRQAGAGADQQWQAVMVLGMGEGKVRNSHRANCNSPPLSWGKDNLGSPAATKPPPEQGSSNVKGTRAYTWHMLWV